MVEKKFIVIDLIGVHARPASLITKVSLKYKSKVSFIFNGKEANAKSVLALMTLGISKGDQFTLKVDGIDEKEALNAIQEKMYSEKLV